MQAELLEHIFPSTVTLGNVRFPHGPIHKSHHGNHVTSVK